jgi:hypothetical protein
MGIKRQWPFPERSSNSLQKSQQAVVEWWSLTNGDIFDADSKHGCSYHDGVTYIVAVKY